MYFKFYFILLISFLYSVTAIAQGPTSGCLSPGGYIYTDRDGSKSGVPNYKFDNESDRYLTPSMVFCMQQSSSNSCYITVKANSQADNAGYGSTYGVYVTFAYVNCPLDDDIPFLLVAIAASGFFFLRNKLF